jgi:hypothetical protein
VLELQERWCCISGRRALGSNRTREEVSETDLPLRAQTRGLKFS